MAKTKKGEGSYQVAQIFRDKDTKELYEVGADVSHFDEARLQDLVERQLVTGAASNADAEAKAAAEKDAK